MSLSIFQQSFRTLISVAHSFVSGEAPFLKFYCACAQVRHEARGVRLDRGVSDLISNWSSLAERCRNEWGESSAPLTEQQVREHIRRELG